MKKLLLAVVAASVVLASCGGNAGSGKGNEAAVAADDKTIKDEKLQPFMLGGVYFFHGYGGGQKTLDDLVKGQMRKKPSDDGFRDELHTIYTNYFIYPFKPEEGAGARQTLSEYWDVGDKAAFIKMQEALLAGGHQAQYLALSAPSASAKTPEETAQLDFINAHKAEFPKGGIKAWDIARYVNNTAMGYSAGYLTKDEGDAALAKLPALAESNYSSWDEYWKGFNLGRKMWNGDKEHDAEFDETSTEMQQGDYSIYKYMKF